jgi:hypothetical protein
MAKTIFTQTNDGVYACWRVNGVLHYESFDEVLEKLGIESEDVIVEIDKEAADRYGRERRRGVVQRPGTDDLWGV